MGKVIFVIIFFGIILFIVYTAVTSVLEESDFRRESNVPILSRFDTKIVYTTNLTRDTGPFEEDCRERGGKFNVCGNICDTGVDVCVQVCAYTCEGLRTNR